MRRSDEKLGEETMSIAAFRIVLACPWGLPRSQVSFDLRSCFSRLPHPDPEVEVSVESVWAAAAAQKKHLYNGTKFRYAGFSFACQEGTEVAHPGCSADGATASNSEKQPQEGEPLQNERPHLTGQQDAAAVRKPPASCALVIKLGLSDYREHVGTSLSERWRDFLVPSLSPPRAGCPHLPAPQGAPPQATTMACALPPPTQSHALRDTDERSARVEPAHRVSAGASLAGPTASSACPEGSSEGTGASSGLVEPSSGMLAPDPAPSWPRDGDEDHLVAAFAHLASTVGNSAVLETGDGFVVMMRRSAQVGECPGLVTFAGGHPEPSSVKAFVDVEASFRSDPGWIAKPSLASAVEEELSSSILREVEEEIGVPLDQLSEPLFLGIAQRVVNARYNFVYLVRTGLSLEEVRRCYRKARDQHESTGMMAVEPHRVWEMASEMPGCHGGAAWLYRQRLELLKQQIITN
eukprot:jgi/Mesvir1/27982/Mv20183-RA.1